jgi:beta-mannosidase
MSSFESMSKILSQDNWSLHGNGTANTCRPYLNGARNCTGTNVMAERNYSCDSHIQAYFGYTEASLSESGSAAFQKQLYMCLIAQTLWMKGEIESRRSRNMYGNLVRCGGSWSWPEPKPSDDDYVLTISS